MSQATLIRALVNVGRELSTGFDAQLKRLGLTAARARVLLMLARSEAGVSQAAVTENLGVEHPTAVRILDGLEALGHIRRIPSPGDRRAKQIVLTDAGRPVAEEVVALTEQISSHLMAGLQADEIETTTRVLLAILDQLAALKARAEVSP